MDKGRGAVSFALSISVSIGIERARYRGPTGVSLETCRPQGKAVPAALFDL
jgi:hypothetical protein